MAGAAQERPFFPKTHPKASTQSPSISPPDEGTAQGLPQLVGTWKLEGQETLLWSIRGDGQFRVHGVFQGRPYRGELVHLGNAAYDVVTDSFTDKITARVEGVRLLTNGRLGPASWLPVWRQGGPGAMGAGDGGACTMIPSEEVASVLTATIVAPKGKAMAGKPRHAIEGCNYVSNLTRNDRAELVLVGGAFTFNQARDTAAQRLVLPGVHYEAFAELGNGILTTHVLRGDTHVRVKLSPTEFLSF